MTNDKKAEEMHGQYQKGYSLSEVGRMFGVTRQSVYSMFKARNLKLRKKKELPFQYFNGIKFSPQNNRYFRKSFGNRELMHRYVWKHHNGEIPIGYDIHHIDGDRSNNKIENLELIKKDEHARKYNARQNQYTKRNKLQ